MILPQIFTFLYFQERNLLLEELLKQQQEPNNESQQVLVHVETDRVQITLLEGKIKEVLTMLKSLNSMVRNDKTLQQKLRHNWNV